LGELVQKVTDIGLAALLVYEYNPEIIDRVECFSSDTITFWIRGVKHFDLQIIEESYRDPKTTIYAKAYADAYAKVLELRDIATRQGAYQKKVGG